MFPDNMMKMELTGDVKGLLDSVGGEGEGSFEGNIDVKMKYRDQFAELFEYAHQTAMGDLFSNSDDSGSDGQFGRMDDLYTKEWSTTIWAKRSEQRLERVEQIKNRDDLSEEERTGKILEVVDHSMNSGGIGRTDPFGGASHPMASVLQQTDYLEDDGGLTIDELTREGLNNSTEKGNEGVDSVDPLALKARTARIKSRLFDMI